MILILSLYFKKYWLLWAEILDKRYTIRKTTCHLRFPKQLEKLYVIRDFPKNLEHFSGSSYLFIIAKGKGPLDTTKIVKK